MKAHATITRIAATFVATSLSLAVLAGCGATSSTSSGGGEASAADQEATAAASEGSEAGASDAASELDYAVPASNYSDLASFSAQTLDGKTFTQDDFAKADVTFINCWATFCGPCLQEMPEIAAWAKTLPDNVQVVTICFDYEGNEDACADILREAGFEGTTLVAGSGDFETFGSKVMFLPTSLVVDSSGKVVSQVLEGAPSNVAGTYSALVSQALTNQGKEPLNA